MKIVFFLTKHPKDLAQNLDALQIIRDTIDQAHQILQVFFYSDGVYHTCGFEAKEQIAYWQSLAKTFGIKLNVCHDALAPRNLSEELPPYFHLSGIPEFIHDCLRAEKVLTLGEQYEV